MNEQKIEISEKAKERIIELIEQSDLFETAEYVCEYKGCHAYAFSFLDKSKPVIYGLPEYLLVNGDSVKKATDKEAREIDTLY